MRATLSPTVYDLTGWVELETLPSSTDGDLRRRVNRVATLDGGAVINDGGFSDADRTIELRWTRDSASTDATVQRLLQSYATLIVSTRAGVFLTAPESLSLRESEATLRLLVLSKLSA